MRKNRLLLIASAPHSHISIAGAEVNRRHQIGIYDSSATSPDAGRLVAARDRLRLHLPFEHFLIVRGTASGVIQ